MGKIVALCGILCRDCEAYVATQANDRRALEEIAKKWSQLHHHDITPEYCLCDGCLTASGRMSGHLSECEIRACAIAHNAMNCAL